MTWPVLVSPNFSFKELIHSVKGEQNHIDNTPPESFLANAERMTALAEGFRALLTKFTGKDTPFVVHSGFRSVVVNRLVGGSGSRPGQKPSAHLTFRAMDFHPFGMDLDQAFNLMRKSDLPYDKLLIERDGKARWIHFQAAAEGKEPRRLAYTAIMRPGGMHYELVP